MTIDGIAISFGDIDKSFSATLPAPLKKQINVFVSIPLMSNHYHVVFYIDRDKAENWGRWDIIFQWHQLLFGTIFSQRFLRSEEPGKVQHKLQDEST